MYFSNSYPLRVLPLAKRESLLSDNVAEGVQKQRDITFQLLPPAPYCLWRSCLRSLCNHKQVCIALTYLQHSLLHKRESLLSDNVAERVQKQHATFSNSYPLRVLPLAKRENLLSDNVAERVQKQHAIFSQLLPPTGTPSCTRGRVF